MLSTLRAMPSYVVALPDRRDFVAKELSRLGLRPDFLDAIDWRGRPIPEGWEGSASNYGSTKSHFAVYKHILARGDQYAAVFEDDFSARPDVLTEFSIDLSSIDFDAIYLTGNYAKGSTRIAPVRLCYDDHLVRAYGIYTLPARIVSRQLADHVVNCLGEAAYVADRSEAMLQFTRRKTFALEAHIGGQRNADRYSWEPRVYDLVKFTLADTYSKHHGSLPVTDERAIKTLYAVFSRFSKITLIYPDEVTLAVACNAATSNRAAECNLFSDDEFIEFAKRRTEAAGRFIEAGMVNARSTSTDVCDRSVEAVYLGLGTGRSAQAILAALKQVVEVSPMLRVVLLHGPIAEDSLKAIRELVPSHKVIGAYGNLVMLSLWRVLD